MTDQEYEQATELERVLYDCAGMLAKNHPSIAEAMTQHTLSIIERAGRIVVNKYPIDTTVNPRVVKMDIIDAVKQELGLK